MALSLSRVYPQHTITSGLCVAVVMEGKRHVFPMTHIGGDCYQTVIEGVEYRFYWFI